MGGTILHSVLFAREELLITTQKMVSLVIVKTLLSFVVMWHTVAANKMANYAQKSTNTLLNHSRSPGEYSTTNAALTTSQPVRTPTKHASKSPQDWRPHFRTPVKGETNIFFTETSCFLDPLRFTNFEPRLVLSQMSACAIESAARANPNAFVYLLYTCRLYPESVARSSSMVGSVFSLPNTFVWYKSINDLFDNSPLHALPARMRSAQYPNHDASDLLRVLLLWKYGGVYLDLDLVVLRSFADLPTNYIGLNGPGEVTSGVLAFGNDAFGHELATELLEEVRTSYNGLEHYAFNGPAAVLRWLSRRCGYKESRFEDTSSPIAVTHNLITQDCKGMSLLAAPVLYPVYFRHTSRLYEERGSDEVMAAMNFSTAVHLYASTAKLKGNRCVRKHSRQPAMLLQEKHCPAVYEHAPLHYQCSSKGFLNIGVSSLVMVCVMFSKTIVF